MKTITIDELGRQKRYQFYCERWLSLDDRVITCKRCCVKSSAQSKKYSGTSHLEETRWPSKIRSQTTTSDSYRIDENQRSKLDAVTIESSILNTKSSSTTSLPPEVVGHGDRHIKAQDTGVPKTTVESILIKFPTFYKSTDWDHLEQDVNKDRYFWLDDQLKLLKEIVPERANGWVLCSEILLDVVVRTLNSPSSEVVINVNRCTDSSTLYPVPFSG